ncbi:unnamed protein product [Mytilus edulis]|uniref:Fibrinogen C-terminal domain-containing protein n=1 Tax=Mytilus edulis TaxID=6550 RepID=A0A8S3S033_MYTED|nr:unnamed protein product [Mytilus edulis]
MKLVCFPYCALLCFITTCTFNAIDEETFKTKGRTRIVQTENTTDVYCKSIIGCADMCLSDQQCCFASYSKGASTCRIDTSERCFVETETLDEWTLIHHNSYRNSLEHHNGHRFSTKDSDNDNHPTNHCATMFPGAWWFNHCVSSDLNGQYFLMTPDAAHRGVYWRLWKGINYSLKGSLMMMRRVSN